MADAILAFSVFSHLSPDANQAWAEEFGRIVAPSGMVFLTLLDKAFFDQVRGAKDAVEAGSADAFAQSLSECFPDLDAARQRYDAREPAYAGLGGGGVRTRDYYGWAAIPPEFIKLVWGNAGFDVVQWVPSGTLFPQAMVGLVKRELRLVPMVPAAELQRREEEYAAELKGLQAELGSRDQALTGVLTSKSWRVTGPLRALGRLLGVVAHG
jgi:hypothetical protein